MIEVEVEDPAWTAALPDAEAVALQAAKAALNHSPGDGGGSLTLLLTNNATVRDLNARFRGKDSATNVLSFPAAETPGSDHLGDIALAFGVCAREAAEQGKPLAHHLSHLVAHGVLHLLGFDHEDEGDAEQMEALERTILRGLGMPDPYAVGSDAHGRP